MNTYIMKITRFQNKELDLLSMHNSMLQIKLFFL